MALSDNLPALATTLKWCMSLVLTGAFGLAAPPPTATAAPLKQYCTGCHGRAVANAGINVEQLIATPSITDSNFTHWQKVAKVLEQRRMPPPKMKQPDDGDREHIAAWIRGRLDDYARKNAGDPGRVTVRRLTSGEYQYTVHDLTGLDLKFDHDFASDSVGGEGFTNFGDVQFMADANLERYLEAARFVADHAVVGSGRMRFFDDPGKSGFELSAIHRINDIYRTNGFRTNSGEGGKPFGMERYTNAFLVCWKYQHRAALGQPKATLEQLAIRDGVSVRFAEHLWTVVNLKNASYPTSTVVTAFRKMPQANRADIDKSLGEARAAAQAVTDQTVGWSKWLLAAGVEAEGGQGDERSLQLTETSLKAESKHTFRYALRKADGKKTASVQLSILPADGDAKDKPMVIWRNAALRTRGRDRAIAASKPLVEMLDQATKDRLALGKAPEGVTLGPNDFVATGPVILEIELPEGAAGGLLEITGEYLPGPNKDAIVRTVVTNAEGKIIGIPSWALLGDSASPAYKAWLHDVLEFASVLPMNSQSEAAPADKDPIPEPFDNAITNNPIRDMFHQKLKYWRRDNFLYTHILDDATRAELDNAWNDLFASFDYHDQFLQFVSNKYKLGITKKIGQLTEADIRAIPEEPRKYIAPLKAEYDAVTRAQLAARPRHINDCLDFASKAWRRPLTQLEKDRLRAFYVRMTETEKMDHGKAIEAVLARILVSPSFLYRLERPSDPANARMLSDWEVASRLSYFLWSSIPDNELRRAAAAGELKEQKNIEAQVGRMLADPKARRMATEFFGQWLGFYRFDQHRGVDAKRFPEFTDEIRASMYDEAISFFEYILRNDRPVGEVLTANYTFVNKSLAKHYGITNEVKSAREPEKVENADQFGRGGVLRLGAVLTATSAPLRTSPVKRGDYVLRRILGTPTPPPPADAGSLPSDDKAFGGMSVKQRLEVHKRNATCAGCHTRIDPLGFPMEKYDPIGRVRTAYNDGKPIDDTSATTDGSKVEGISGLLAYLKTQDQQVMQNMSRKLIGYALGRTVVPGDQQLVDKLVSGGSNTTFAKMIAEIAASKQFRYRRDAEETSSTPKPPERKGNVQQTAVTSKPKNPTQKEGTL